MDDEREQAEFIDYEGLRRRRGPVIPRPPLEAFGGPRGDEGFGALLREAAEILDMDLVLLGHVNQDRYTVVALHCRNDAYPLAKGDVIPIVETYCRQEITWATPFVMGDALLEPRFSEHPGYTKHKLRAYVGAPVLLKDQTIFGTLCGVDVRPRTPPLRSVERLLEISNEISEIVWERLRRTAAVAGG